MSPRRIESAATYEETRGFEREANEMADEQPQPPPDDYESPVRHLWALAHDQPFIALPDLESARKHPDAVMIMEADSGGQILATLPVRYLAATEAALTQLLCDLESITWGEGGLAEDGDTPCDARIYYEVMSRPGGVGGGMGGGLAVDGLWVHDELAERGLIGPIGDVLRGQSPRLPFSAMDTVESVCSIDEAKRARGARLLFKEYSALWTRPFLSCDVDRLHCGEEELASLYHELDLLTSGQLARLRRRRDFDSLIKPIRKKVELGPDFCEKMGLFTSPTGSGIHPLLRADGPRPPIWIDWRLEKIGLTPERVGDVLDGRLPRISLEGLGAPRGPEESGS